MRMRRDGRTYATSRRFQLIALSVVVFLAATQLDGAAGKAGATGGFSQMATVHGNAGNAQYSHSSGISNRLSFNFGKQALGTLDQKTYGFTFENIGSAPFNLFSITITGDYADTNNCPAQLAGGASCQFTVSFTPTGLGLRSGALTITSTASNSPDIGSFTGEGIPPVVSALLDQGLLAGCGKTPGFRFDSI
jgi:hypothetical protein